MRGYGNSTQQRLPAALGCAYSDHMRKMVGARELKTRLGRYLRAVRSGSIIVVTDRGEPVAELRPIRTKKGDLEAALDVMVALGLLTRGSGEPLEPATPVRVSGGPVSRTIAEGREDRF